MAFPTNEKNKVAFILGAGFSKCADLPVQAEFSSLFRREAVGLYFSDQQQVCII